MLRLNSGKEGAHEATSPEPVANKPKITTITIPVPIALGRSVHRGERMTRIKTLSIKTAVGACIDNGKQE